jgi:hypothetical protein
MQACMHIHMIEQPKWKLWHSYDTVVKVAVFHPVSLNIKCIRIMDSLTYCEVFFLLTNKKE